MASRTTAVGSDLEALTRRAIENGDLASLAKAGSIACGGITMATMNISLPDSMKEFIEDQAARRGFGTVSEYMRSVIREVQRRQDERARIDALLIEGLDSGPASAMTQGDWESIRTEVHRRHAERQGRTNGPKSANRR